MKRLISTAIALLFAAGAGAQSLAEIAKKEKERRAKLDTKSTKTITDTELARSGGPMTTSTTTTSSSTDDGTSETEDGEEATDEAADAPDPQQTREYWQNRLRAVDQRIQSLEARLASPELTSDPRGAVIRQQAERDLAAARAERQAIVQEGRRAGVPPGWLR